MFKNTLLQATEAGAVELRRFFNGSFTISSKASINDLVTEADHASEKAIFGVIQKSFPDHFILSEETGALPQDSEYKWIIDPIDGTKAFIHGVPLYGVMIALEVDGIVRLGVVNFPALCDLYYAELGFGAFLNGSPITVSSVANIADATVLYTEKEYLLDSASIHPVDSLRHEACLVRGWGDCYGHMLVASGRAEVSIDKIMSPWDCAALIPIVTEAGGCCFDYKGVTTISGQGLVSANKAIGTALLASIDNK